MRMRRYAWCPQAKLPREVILLRGAGCSWARCTFCDYHLDQSSNTADNIRLNAEVIGQVQGVHVGNTVLQVGDSGSFPELPFTTIMDILNACTSRGITMVVLESHWLFRETLPAITRLFERQGVEVRHLAGVETFHITYRDQVLKKGMGGAAPEAIARYFQWVDILYGLDGQSLDTLTADITIGLARFERILLNIFVNNRHATRNQPAIDAFYTSSLFTELRDHPQVEILDIADPRAPDNIGFVGYDDDHE